MSSEFTSSYISPTHINFLLQICAAWIFIPIHQEVMIQENPQREFLKNNPVVTLCKLCHMTSITLFNSYNCSR